MSIDHIVKILEQASGNSLDVYAVLYQNCIQNEEDAPHILQTIFEYQETVGTDDGESSAVPAERERELHSQYRPFLLEQVKALTEQNDSPEIFYRHLWENVLCSTAGPRNQEEGAVCLKILNEEIPLLPYFQAVDPLQMSDEDFSAAVKDLAPRIQETIHMLNRRFGQKTEKTSQLCRIMKTLSDEEAAVYLAVLLNLLQENFTRAGYEKARREQEQKQGEPS